MSHYFYIANVTRLSVSRVVNQCGFDDLVFLENFPQPNNDYWPDEPAYIYLDRRSGRTLETSFEGNTFQLRVFAGSSPADYQFALKLAHAIATIYHQAIRTEDNTLLDTDAFFATFTHEWISQHCKAQLSAVLAPALEYTDRKGHVSGVHRPMSIGQHLIQDLKDDPDGVAKAFFKRQRRLNYIDQEGVFIANLMRVQLDELGTTIKVSTYSQGVATLINDQNTVVSFHNGFYNNLDKDDIAFHIPAKALKSILGNTAIWLSDDYLLVPELKGDDWINFIAKAKQYEIKDLTAFKMSSKELEDMRFLSPEDTETLASAPILAFSLIARSTTGIIDKKAIETFKSQMLSSCIQDNAFTQSIVLHTISKFDVLCEDILNDPQDPNFGLASVVYILADKVHQTDAIHFRNYLLSLAQSVAEISGGFLGIFGNRVTKQDRHAIESLERTLNFALESAEGVV